MRNPLFCSNPFEFGELLFRDLKLKCRAFVAFHSPKIVPGTRVIIYVQAQVTGDVVEFSTSLDHHLCRNKGDALVIGLVDLFEIDSVDVVGRRFSGYGGKQSERIFSIGLKVVYQLACPVLRLGILVGGTSPSICILCPS